MLNRGATRGGLRDEDESYRLAIPVIPAQSAPYESDRPRNRGVERDGDDWERL